MKIKFRLIIVVSLFAVLASLLTAIIIILRFESDATSRMTLLLSISIVMLTTISIVVLVWKMAKKQRIEIKKSFEKYMEELISIAGVGTIMFNNEGVIIWTSKFVNDRFNNSLMGKNIIEISSDFTKRLYENKAEFIFETGNIFYEAIIVKDSNSIIIKDVSEKKRIKDQYIKERMVIGEIDIDNFQEYMSTLPEEEVFSIQSSVINTLDKLVKTYNIIYRQYVNGKFLVITDSETLEEMKENKFKSLTTLKTDLKDKDFKITVSAGFGVGSTIPYELMQLAKDSIAQSQSRGGNQITICSLKSGYSRFGAKTEAFSSSSRVIISKISKLFFKKMKDPSVKTVLVYGHKMADLDALGSTYAVYEQAISMGKKAYIVGAIFDNSTKKAISAFIENSKDVFIKPTNVGKYANESTMVILCDVADPSRTENSLALQNIPENNIFIFDHHRLSALPSGVKKSHTYIDPSASSASEIISEIIQYSGLNLKPSMNASQLLLSGIYLDTKIFQKQVSSRTFSAAAWLETFGARAQESSELLKFSEEQSALIKKILSNIEEVKPGYYLAAYDGEADSDIVASAADEMLRTHGRMAAFVIAKMPNSKMYKMSARSINVNIQLIAEDVGGGGHFSASAAASNESIEVFKDNLIQSIVSRKDESNNS